MNSAAKSVFYGRAYLASDRTIKRHLMDSGYDKRQIRAAFRKAGKRVQLNPRSRTYEEQKALKDRWEKAHGINYQIPGSHHV